MRISDWSSDVCSSDRATMADRMGLDFLVSVARWSGFDGPSRFAQEAFETLTYIAGLAAVTNRILVFSTVHVPIVHPLIAAKAMATIDRKSTRLNSSHSCASRMLASACKKKKDNK